MHFGVFYPERTCTEQSRSSRETQCKQKGFVPILVLIGILVITIIASGAYYFGIVKNSSKIQNPIIVSQTPAPVVFAQPTSTPFKFLDQNQTSAKSEIAQICEEIFKLPSNPNAGITFEQSYCQGDQCHSAKTKSECESKDIIKIENGRITSSKDGKVDCEWTENLGFYSCGANL